MSRKSVFGNDTPEQIVPPPYMEYTTSFAYVPSWKVIKNLACKYFTRLDEFETRVMQGIDGIMFKGDASHKVTKLVYVNTDEKVYLGLYTLMNEFGEIIGWWFIRTGWWFIRTPPSSSSSSSSSSHSSSSSSSPSLIPPSSNNNRWNVIDDVISIDDMNDEEYAQEVCLAIPTLLEEQAIEEAEKKGCYIATS